MATIRSLLFFFNFEIGVGFLSPWIQGVLRFTAAARNTRLEAQKLPFAAA
jgi:hypothetical protein